MFNAEEYSEHNCTQRLLAEQIIKDSKIQLPPDSFVLDLACGDGGITKSLFTQKLQSGNLLGVDISEDMIAHAKQMHVVKFFKKSQKKILNFLAISAENFVFEKKFNAIFSFFGLHWVHDQRKTFENVSRNLAPGGGLYFVVPVQHEQNMVYKVLEELENNKKWKDIFTEISFKNEHKILLPQVYDGFLLSNSLKIKKFSVDITHHFYDNVTKLRNFFRCWLPHVRELRKQRPKEEEPFLIALSDLIIKLGERQGQKIFFTQTMLTVYAEKPKGYIEQNDNYRLELQETKQAVMP